MKDRSPRSPRYPSLGLSEAVTRAKQLFDHEGRTPADREVIAQALGYAGRNGASDRVLATLSHFGLLEDVDSTRLRLSDIALDIILNDTGNEERTRAVEIAAWTPALFQELKQQFGDGKYSNRNLESYLLKNGFNVEAASKATKAYRETVDFVNQERVSTYVQTTEDADSDSGNMGQNDQEQTKTVTIPKNEPETVRSNRPTLTYIFDDDGAIESVQIAGEFKVNDNIESLLQAIESARKLAKGKKKSSPTHETQDEDGDNQ